MIELQPAGSHAERAQPLQGGALRTPTNFVPASRDGKEMAASRRMSREQSSDGIESTAKQGDFGRVLNTPEGQQLLLRWRHQGTVEAKLPYVIGHERQQTRERRRSSHPSLWTLNRDLQGERPLPSQVTLRSLSMARPPWR
jgi:hypothetical protein